MNVLFVCRDNCALSLMAESILAAEAPKRFGAFSAGFVPGKAANPYVLEFLATHDMHARNPFPKGLESFRMRGAPKMDFIITLCETAAAENFSDWPDAPFIAHWNVQDERDDTADRKSVV